MKKFITFSVFAAIFVALLFCTSCGSGKEEAKESTGIPTPAADTTKPVVIQEEPKEKEPERKEINFTPTRIEVSKLINKIDTSYSGEGCDCPTIGRTYKFRVFISDSAGKEYAVEVGAWQPLKNYEGSDDFKKAKLVSTQVDGSDPDYARAKNAYQLLTSLPTSSIQANIKWQYSDTWNMTLTDTRKKPEVKVGTAYLKDASDHTILAKTTDASYLVPGNELR